MDEPSTSRQFNLSNFLCLPWHIRREIISNLSPMDMLNLAESDETLKELIIDCPKRLRSITSNCDLSVEVERGGRTRRYCRDYYTDKYHPKKIERFLRDEMQGYSLVFCEGDDHRAERDLELLVTNCTLDVFESPSTKQLGLGTRAAHLDYPTVENVEEILQILESFQSTGLNLINNTVFETSESVDKLLTHPQIASLNCLSMSIKQEHLHKFSNLNIPKFVLFITDHSDGVGSLLLSMAEQTISQWEKRERELDLFMLSLETNDDFGEDEIENILNFELNEFAHQLAFGRLGSFKEKTIDRRFRLIKRLDGTGLLIVSGALSIVLIQCDYAYRRERGLGTSSKFEELRNSVESNLYQLKMFEENEEKIRKHGKEITKEYPEEIIDTATFSIFGIEMIDEDTMEANQNLSEGSKKDDEKKEESDEIRKEKAIAELEQDVKELNKYCKGISFRELAIDQLWEDQESQINKGVIRDMLNGLKELGFPSIPCYDRFEQRHAVEYADACRRVGRLLPYYESI